MCCRSTTASGRALPRTPRGSRARATISSSMPAWGMCRPTSRPTCAAAATPSRPMSRSATPGAEGVLIAHGDATSGYSLYVKDGHLVHDLNIGGGHEIVRSDRRIPAGARRLGVHVERLVRETPPAKGARTGVSRLYAADRRRAGRIAADPARIPHPDLVVGPRHRPRSLEPGVALRGAVRIHRTVAAGHGRHA